MVQIQLAGENAVIVYFEEPVSPVLSQRIAFYQRLLHEQFGDALIDSVPSYNSLLLTYRLRAYLHDAFCEQVRSIIEANPFKPRFRAKDTIEIPVWYDAAVGLDLNKVMAEKNLNLETLINLHTETTYHVYAIGFSPAFAFLGQLAPALHQSRHSTPRLKVPAGSVGIADDQTAIYPIDSPGGWHIIGKTPWDLSLADPENLNRFQVGQKVRFKAIDDKAFAAMGGAR